MIKLHSLIEATWKPSQPLEVEDSRVDVRERVPNIVDSNGKGRESVYVERMRQYEGDTPSGRRPVRDSSVAELIVRTDFPVPDERNVPDSFW